MPPDLPTARRPTPHPPSFPLLTPPPYPTNPPPPNRIRDFSHKIGDLLDANIPALIYVGDVDYICNYMGNRAWTQKLDWNSGDKFRAATDHPWGGADGGDGAEASAAAGLARSVDGFTFLQVYDAGHMVPQDKPEVALRMISDFVNGVAF